MTCDRFAAKIAVSTTVMFGLMYSNPYKVSLIWLSQTRMWMALRMGAGMRSS